jgi:hypothetical protein
MRCEAVIARARCRHSRVDRAIARQSGALVRPPAPRGSLAHRGGPAKKFGLREKKLGSGRKLFCCAMQQII